MTDDQIDLRNSVRDALTGFPAESPTITAHDAREMADIVMVQLENWVGMVELELWANMKDTQR